MPTFTKRSTMPVTAAALAAYHEQPGALDRLVPPWENVRVLEREGDCYEGRVLLSVPAGPFRLRWEAVHSGGVRGSYFIDRQASGPFATYQHRHSFIAPESLSTAPQTSELDDTIEWTAPFGALGAAIGGIQKRLDSGFAFRHVRTAEDLRRHAEFPRGPLRILVSGASGLVGKHLIPFLTVGGHTVIRLVRRAPKSGEAFWDPATNAIDLGGVGEIDAVIHLSGESVSKRWTEARKAEILRSREQSTLLLANAIAKLPKKPEVFVSASAVGWYGNRGTERMTETSTSGTTGFLPEVCRRWEAATEPARVAGIRTVNLRIGVVVSARGGALAELLPPVRAGVGGVVGSGEQMFPWIAIDDLVHLIHWLLGADLAGPVNATAPNPVNNRQFMTEVGKAVHRWTIFPLPAPIVRLMFGKMGQEVLLEGQNAVPERALAAGFRFTFDTLDSALRWELGP
jgi:uncharacterized protein (TIGR01777 family)